MNKFYQYCFTRLGGNAADAGWQSLNKSGDIPQELVNAAERIAKDNHISESSKAPLGVAMHQIFTEPQSDGLGVARVYYSGVDPFGRVLYYNHAYLFENAYEMLKEPNNVLGIADSNFRYTAEETADIPTDLQYSEPLCEAQALEACGMTAESYAAYMKAIFRIFYETAKKTIYVKTDGSDKMAKDLLYLTYSALPYSLRHRITAETYAKPKSAEGCSLVFTDNIPERVKYVDPVTGANNVVDAALDAWLSKYGYALYYVNAYPNSVAHKKEYFGGLEDILTKIGLKNTENNDLLNLAFKVGTTKTESLSNDELVRYFNEWLSLNLPLNDYVIGKLCSLLEMVTARDITINDVITTKIVDKISKSQSEKLTDKYLQYLNSYMGKMSEDEAYKFMLIQRKDAGLFAKLIEVIKANAAGMRILMDYYVREAKLLAANDSSTYETLEKFLVPVPNEPEKQTIRQIFVERCEAIALEKQRTGAAFNAVYGEYQNAFKSICEGIAVKFDVLVGDYDVAFRNQFDCERIGEYANFYSTFVKAFPALQPSAEFIYASTAVANRDIQTLMKYLHNGCRLTDGASNAPEDKQTYANNLYAYAIHTGLEKDSRFISVWINFARLLNKELYSLLAQTKVALLLEPEAMQESLAMDEFWNRSNSEGVSNIEKFFSEAVEYINKHPDEEAVSKKVMDVLKNEIKERKKNAKEELAAQRKADKEQRKAEKEQLKAEKAQAKEENSGEKKGNFFANLFSGMGAKKDKPVEDPYGISDLIPDDISGEDNGKNKKNKKKK